VTSEATGGEQPGEQPHGQQPHEQQAHEQQLPRESAEEKYESRAVERLIFFSDAVTAIAITLLAIDLPVPSGATTAAFWASVRQNDGVYLAFLVSFVTIAASWSSHHDAFRHLRRFDPRLRTMDMVWLLMIILVPFATKLLTGGGHDSLTVHAFRWGFYALLQTLTSAVLFAMAWHMRDRGLLEPGSEEADRAASDWRTYGPMLGFGLSIPVFFATSYGWVLWFAVPLALHRLRRYDRFRWLRHR
jgi:uncharacterized membrane protein